MSNPQTKTHICVNAETVTILKSKYPGAGLSHAIDLAARDLDRADRPDGGLVVEALTAFAERQAEMAAAQRQTLDRIVDIVAKLAEAGEAGQGGDDKIARIVDLLTNMTNAVAGMSQNIARMSGDTMNITNFMDSMSDTLESISQRVQ